MFSNDQTQRRTATQALSALPTPTDLEQSLDKDEVSSHVSPVSGNYVKLSKLACVTASLGPN
jgi:hypothetical protein